MIAEVIYLKTKIPVYEIIEGNKEQTIFPRKGIIE